MAAAQGKAIRNLPRLPDNDFGHAMAQALIQAASINGAAPPNVRLCTWHADHQRCRARPVGLCQSPRPIDAQIRAARALETPEGRRQPQDLAKSSIPPPSFNSLLLADTGDALAEIAAVLAYYDVDRSASADH